MPLDPEAAEEETDVHGKLLQELKKHSLNVQILEDDGLLTDFATYEKEYERSNNICGCSFSFLKPKKKIKTPPKKINVMVLTPAKNSILIGDNCGYQRQISSKANKKGQIQTRNFGQIHKDEVISICVSSDEKYVYTLAKDGYVKKVSLTEKYKTKEEQIWRCQKTHSEMIDLFWTRQKLVDQVPICMILTKDDKYLYIGVQDALLMVVPTNNLSDAKQSNYMYKGITAMVAAPSSNNNLFLGDRKGNVVQIVGNSIGKDELLLQNSFLGIHEGQVTDQFIGDGDGRNFQYSGSNVDMHIYVYNIEQGQITALFNLDFFSEISSMIQISYKQKDYILIACGNQIKVFNKDNEEGDYEQQEKEKIKCQCV